MSKIKAVVDFSGYTGPALAPVAKTIHDQMTAKAANFPVPPVTMVAFQGLITTFAMQKVDSTVNCMYSDPTDVSRCPDRVGGVSASSP